MSKLICGVLLGVVISGCASWKIHHNPQTNISLSGTEKARHSIYFFGGMTAGKEISPQLLELIQQKIAQSEDPTILFLGNNLGAKGLPDAGTISQKLTLGERLKWQSLQNNVFVLRGNHEWDKGGPRGMQQVQYINHIIRKELDLKETFLPENGCPGPAEIQLADDMVLLIIDTQWWLHQWEKPAIANGCEVSNPYEMANAIHDAILRHADKRIIVAGHHSLASSGKKSGHFSLKPHFFPLTLINDKAYIPLPGLGSLYIGYRKILGDIQDTHNPVYKNMIKVLSGIFRQHHNLIYLSAHEQSLEYHFQDRVHLINSGSIASGVPLHPNKAEYSSSNTGFGALDIYEDGTVALHFWSDRTGSESPLFSKILFKEDTKPHEQSTSNSDVPDYADSVVTAYATKAYIKANKRPGMLGNNYRKVWSTPIQGVPVFDIGKVKGGLTIDKKGGGMQTKSLRLRAKNDTEWVLRSIEKFPENAVPPELRGTFAERIIKEQISAAHPYAAFVVPPLADAAGVYHTNPSLVYLPDDPRLGIYRKEFGGGLYLFEERPDDERKDVASFGRPTDIISTEDVIDEIIENGNNSIDQEMVLRSRLFDIWIGDWDRHDDQWRWAQFEYDDGFDVYRPIPRDRDNVFFWSDGWLMDIGTRRWGLPKFQGFHHKIRDVAGFSFNARHFDRTFLTRPTLNDWIEIAGDLQSRLTDEVIENAIQKFPDAIYKLHGEIIISKLKQRRDDLKQYADTYYKFLARKVDVLGSEKNDLFEIRRLDDQKTIVKVYEIEEDTEDILFKYYERIFYTDETDEIRLYGFEDEDVFVIDGEVNRGIKIRIIGGEEEDKIIDHSRVSGIGKHTLVYDTKTNTILQQTGEVKDLRSDRDPLINQYNRKAFEYDLTAPLLFSGFNPDDGIFVGGGAFIRKHGFRKTPYQSQHLITGIIAPKSASFNIDYQGEFTELIGSWNGALNVGLYYPSYSNFFYGYGNETNLDKSRIESDNRYYAARYRQIIINPTIYKTSKNEHHTLTIGGQYRFTNVREGLNINDDQPEQTRFIVNYQERVDHDILSAKRHYLQGYLEYELDTRNNVFLPQNGFYFHLHGGYEIDLDNNDLEVDYTFWKGSAAFYATFGNTLKTTLAARGGGAVNNGGYEFYQANTLGGTSNLRGYRKQRFAGDKTAYQNTDLRVRLFKFWSVVLPGEAGIVLFNDFGRIWHDNDPSTTTGTSDFWHHSYGAGIYLAPLEKAALTLDYSRSNTDESAVFVRLGFLF